MCYVHILCAFFKLFVTFFVQTEVDSSHKSDEVRNSLSTCLQSQVFSPQGASLNTLAIIFHQGSGILLWFCCLP